MKKAGTIIFVIGLFATMFTGFSFVTREKVIDMGKLEIMTNKNHELAWKPVLGLVVMLTGGIVSAFGSKKINGPNPTTSLFTSN